VIVDARAEFDFLDLDDLLFLLGLVLFLLFFVFELAEIEDLADRRIGVGRDLDQVEAGFGRHVQSLVATDDAHHLAMFINKADLRD
jgi:hypothetical protein